jgi:hypothetical protein
MSLNDPNMWDFGLSELQIWGVKVHHSVLCSVLNKSDLEKNLNCRTIQLPPILCGARPAVGLRAWRGTIRL